MVLKLTHTFSPVKLAKNMTNLSVFTQPNPILRTKSSPVDEAELLTKKHQQFINEMKETMRASNGIGIAAPQVGIHKRIIIVDLDGRPEAFVNPRIVSASFRKVESEEGCLSVPGVYGIVKRHKSVRVEAINEDGLPQAFDVDGLPAIIFQHEIDHLDGVLFIDKVTRFTSPPRL